MATASARDAEAAVAPALASLRTASEARVLRDANALLAKIGFGARQFERFEDLVASVSSMSVALYEKLFQLRLDHVVRVPQRLADYEANAQIVVDALASALLEHSASARAITGKALCAGDTHSIERVVRMFEQVFSILEDASARGERVELGALASGSGTHAPSSSAPAQQQQRQASTKTRPKTIKTRTSSRSTASRMRQLNASSDSSDSDNRRERRVPRRRSQQQTHLTRELPLPPTPSDANLYETSDASITRSRGRDLPSRSRRAVASVVAQAPAAHHASARNISNSISATSEAKGSEDAAAAAKKRSRRLTQSPVDAPSQRSETKSVRSKVLSASSTSKRRSRLAPVAVANDPNLLATQKYGRFVPVATARAPRPSAHDSESEDRDAGDDHAPMYFGGVSSVSSGSRSDESVHFIEDDGDDTRDFSSSRVGVDLQNVPPPNALSPSNAYDDDDDDDTRLKPTRSLRTASRGQRPSSSRGTSGPGASAMTLMQDPHVSTGTTTAAAGAEARRKSKTQADDGAEAEDPIATAAGDAQNAAPSAAPRASERESAAPLYPLLPKHASKAQAEFLRYKLYLKDHLQALRQREFCQRQHMARAYRVGEHSANVEKIRARRFQQDIRLQRIAIGLESRHEEEKQLRETLAHVLALEKAKLRDEHRATASVLKQIQKDHAARESAMETFYANQIELVKEQTHREVHERELVEKAHRMASEQMIRELRREREDHVAALVREQQHLEEARRFRSATKLSTALERGDDARVRASDAFYAAAMRARELRSASSSAPKQPATKARAKAATARAYGASRPAPARRRVK